MNDVILQGVLAFLAGAVAAAFWLGGLWWTVNALPSARAPALLGWFSMVIRLAAVAAVFWVAAANGVGTLLPAFVSFLAVRMTGGLLWSHAALAGER